MNRKTTLRNNLTDTVVSGDPVAAIPVQGGEIDPELIDEPDQDPQEEETEPEPEPVSEEIPAAAEDDGELSLVGSLYLHLLSEHGDYDSLALDDDEAISEHARMHLVEEPEHGVRDWRFHPARALEVARRRPLDPPA